MIRYFILTQRVKTKILIFDELTDETVMQFTEYISNILTKQSITIFL